MTGTIISQLLPVFIILGIGAILRRFSLISGESVDGLKNIIIKVSLPAVLYLAFATIQLNFDFVILGIIIFCLCILLYGLGIIFAPYSGPYRDFLKFVSTGFEFGMLGAVFFGAAFGMENMGYIAVIAIGHEIFIWFVYFSFIKNHNHADSSIKDTVTGFLTSPVIIGILSGIFMNITGLHLEIIANPVGEGIIKTMNYLIGLTVPLILLVIGYGLRIHLENIKSAVLFSFCRLAVVTAIAVAIDIILFRGILQLPKLYSAALYIFMLLPPPFILPLFLNSGTKERDLINNTLIVYTVLSICAFTTYYIFYTVTA
ncbi:MAG: hypothetical protein PF637_12435 [Spirochaetes bacterium]|jgi:predicted permease|nr:hypothetical protein [Spirochaetota bacterium]